MHSPSLPTKDSQHAAPSVEAERGALSSGPLRAWLERTAHDADAMFGAALALRDLPRARRSAWLDALAAEAQTLGADAAAAVAVLERTAQLDAALPARAAAKAARTICAYRTPIGLRFEYTAEPAGTPQHTLEIALHVADGELVDAKQCAPSQRAAPEFACDLDDALDEAARLIWRRTRAGRAALPALSALAPYMRAQYNAASPSGLP